MKLSQQSIAKQVGAMFLRPSFLVFRFCLRTRYFGRRIPRQQVVSYFILRKFVSICRRHEIETWAFDGTLLGAIRDNKFAGRPGDFDFIIREEDAEQLHSLMIDSLFSRTSFIRWFPLFKQTYAMKSSGSGNKMYYKVFVLGQKLQLIEIMRAKLVDQDNQRSLVFDSAIEGKEMVCDLTDFLEHNQVKIYDIEVRVPKNPERYLEILFGTDWRTPRITKTEKFEREPHLWSVK